MANLRRTKTPDNLEAFASALSGFGQEAINRAITRIEEADVTQGEPAFPRLGKLLEECRKEASTYKLNGDLHHWSIDEYRKCKDFDKYMQEQMETYHMTEAQMLLRFPGTARKWLAWKKQLRDGTLVCPHWCDVCDGVGWLFSINEDQEQVAVRCHACKK
jgi:hypothetical protein